MSRRSTARLIAVVLPVFSIWALWFGLFSDLPSLASVGKLKRNSVQFVDRQGIPLYEALDGGERQRPVPLDAFSPALIQATIATEDSHFYEHIGVDALGLLRAVSNAIRGEPGGGSTITQQLVRNVVLSSAEQAESTLRRKVREIWLALCLERRLSKDEILAAYLNSAPYGHGSIGAEAASRLYFGKPADQLSLAEAAMLAGLPQSPIRLDPYSHFAEAKGRQRLVLDRLTATGYLRRDQAEIAFAEPIQLAALPNPVLAPHAVFGARDAALELAREVNGRRIVLTIDAGLQRLAEDAIERHLKRLAGHDATNAALVAIDPSTGEILALAGSADYFDVAIDGAVNVATSPRQPGSAIKPLTYAAAFERGFGPASVLPDVRTVFQTRHGEPFVPVNYDLAYHGPLSLKVGLASSINVIAVSLLDRIGVGVLVDLGRAMGLTTWKDADRYDLALTLGGGEVSLLDLTAAYGAFANRGLLVAPMNLIRIEDSAGYPVWLPGKAHPYRVVSPETAFLVSYVLSDPAARELGFGPDSPLELGRPAAVKTGTTAAFRDNWTIGYTPDLVVGVWVGNSSGAPMRQVTGVSGAAPIWHDFLAEALKDRSVRPFVPPDTIEWLEVCAIDGLLPSEECRLRQVEPFAPGGTPKMVSTSYLRVEIDAPTGLLAGSDCPGPVIERSYWVAPIELRAWAREAGVDEPPARTCYGTTESLGQARTARIVSPDDGAIYRLSRRLPLESQRVWISAAALGGPAMIWLDGEPLGSNAVFAPLSPGLHEVTAGLQDPDGGVQIFDRRRFVVELDQEP